MINKFVFVIFSVLIFGAVVNGQEGSASKGLTLDPGVKPHKGIDQIYSRFSEAYKALDPEMVTELYTESAFYLTPQSGMDRGKELIRNNFGNFFRSVKERKGSLSISFQIMERKVSGELGYDVGVYTLSSKNADGQMSTSRGKFVVIALKQKNGEWKFQLDAYSNLPNEEK